jgi:hypothetical protein
MSEVHEQAAHAATLGVQRWKINGRSLLLRREIRLRRLRLHATFVRLPLGVEWRTL